MDDSNKKEIIIVDNYYQNINEQNIDNSKIKKKTNDIFSNFKER
jgi:hypothetical protein